MEQADGVATRLLEGRDDGPLAARLVGDDHAPSDSSFFMSSLAMRKPVWPSTAVLQTMRDMVAVWGGKTMRWRQTDLMQA